MDVSKFRQEAGSGTLLYSIGGGGGVEYSV